MAVNNTVTVTGSIGPGLTVSDLLIEHVQRLEFDFEHQVVNVVNEQGNVKSFQYTDIDTVTFVFPGTTADGGTDVTIEAAS